MPVKYKFLKLIVKLSSLKVSVNLEGLGNIKNVGCPFVTLSILIGIGRIGILKRFEVNRSIKNPIGERSFLKDFNLFGGLKNFLGLMKKSIIINN
jgi:hypothetical protein